MLSAGEDKGNAANLHRSGGPAHRRDSTFRISRGGLQLLIDSVPSSALSGKRRLEYASDFANLNHYLFRFPAKFHPPVVKALLELYTKPGQLVLDPFCGSGTGLVEALAIGRSCIGIDVDPLSAFVSRVKTHRYSVQALRGVQRRLAPLLQEVERSDSEYTRRMFSDITEETVYRNTSKHCLWIPEMPNIFHWFRRYVVVDLAHIQSIVSKAPMTIAERDFFRLCFASIIRASSNADPVPVSGLEVTSHIKKRDAEGRKINPFDLFRKSLDKALRAVEDFNAARSPHAECLIMNGDATELLLPRSSVDCVLTSPPYHNAVDYYRRHKLEMFWTRLVVTQEDRETIIPKYIGRSRVRQTHPFLAESIEDLPTCSMWEKRMKTASGSRHLDFRHYAVATRKVFRRLHASVKRGGSCLFIVGHSSWNGYELPTADLFQELAQPSFILNEILWYPITNRYMSYSRHNGASIDKEYVLVFRRA
jgi:16S rRNA G966 N2-methylase RsmD